MKSGSLLAVEDGSVNLVEPHAPPSMQKPTEIDLRHMMKTLDLEDALAESVQHARFHGERDVALSLAMILEGLRVRLWDLSYSRGA